MLDDEGTLSEKHLRLLRGLGEYDWGAGGQNLFSGFPIGDMLDFCPSRILENRLDQSHRVVQALYRSSKCGHPDCRQSSTYLILQLEASAFPLVRTPRIRTDRPPGDMKTVMRGVVSTFKNGIR